MVSSSHQVYTNTGIESYLHLNTYTRKKVLALGPRFRQVLAPQRRLLLLPGVAIWEISEILGGLVIHSSHHVSTNPEIKPFLHLTTYQSKDSSAWTKVSTSIFPPTAAITAPGGRDLGDF